MYYQLVFYINGLWHTWSWLTTVLSTLYHYCITGIAYDWLNSYLQNWLHYVAFDNCEFDLLIHLWSITRFSLTANIFILYINDICKTLKLHKFILIADDTNICFGNDTVQMNRIINPRLDKLSTLFAINKLLSKTNVMLFRNYNKNSNIVISITITRLTQCVQLSF